MIATKAASVIFGFWILFAVVMLVAVMLHPVDAERWLMLAVGIFGAALYFPGRGTVQIRKSIRIRRPVRTVYDFLSQPDNLHLWNPRVGRAQPPSVPVEVGQVWTYAPRHRRVVKPYMRHAFSVVEPPHKLEIRASGRDVVATYAYTIDETGSDTQLTLDCKLTGMTASLALLSSALARMFPSGDLIRLKRALERTEAA